MFFLIASYDRNFKVSKFLSSFFRPLHPGGGRLAWTPNVSKLNGWKARKWENNSAPPHPGEDSAPIPYPYPSPTRGKKTFHCQLSSQIAASNASTVFKCSKIVLKAASHCQLSIFNILTVLQSYLLKWTQGEVCLT